MRARSSSDHFRPHAYGHGAVVERESAVATAAPSRAVDYLVLALAEGPLERDALIEAAQALGSKNKHLGVYLGQQKREADGFITQYLGRYELTRKGREQVTALGGPIVVVQEG